MDSSPDRSTVEIKNLLLKLNPCNGSHKDRVRALTKFRNYVSGSATNNKKYTTPEFYDDDIPLLFLGSESSHAFYDADTYGDLSNYFGLLSACATPSTDHTGGLKRSARNAMNLLKFLVLDYHEVKLGEVVPPKIDNVTGLAELNPFADALCSLKPEQLRLANFEQHVKDVKEEADHQRAGAKNDACQVLALLFSRHYTPNTTTGSNHLLLTDLLDSPQAIQSFENWMVQNISKEQQQMIKSNAYANKSVAMNATESLVEETDDNFGFKKRSHLSDPMQSPSDPTDTFAEEQMDSLGIKLYNKKDMMGSTLHSSDLPTRWEDSKLAQAQIQLDTHNAVSEKDEEKLRIYNEEKQQILRRDPLNIRPDNFDLKYIQEQAVELLQDAIHDMEEEMEEYEPRERFEEVARKRRKARDKYAYSVEHLVSLGSQKNALEAILYGKDIGESPKNDNEEEKSTLKPAQDLSILPSDPNFNPMLFLTLVHKNTSYEELVDSMKCLDSEYDRALLLLITAFLSYIFTLKQFILPIGKIDDQMDRIQNRVRDNFDLYIRCADGIDLFSDKAGKGKIHGPGVHKRIEKLEAIADSAAEQAAKSFKPLIDNTNEVRKVQSALAVLSRIGPILEVPSIMRKHIENGRFAEAVKAYRKVLVIDEKNNIDILKHVKSRAAEAAREARHDLECRLANPSLPVQSILDSIRDLNELNELDIPEEPFTHKKEEKDCGHPRVKILGPGRITVGNADIDIRDHPPSLACLLLQAAHFSQTVLETVEYTESTVQRIFSGESLSSMMDEGEDVLDEKTVDNAPSSNVLDGSSTSNEKGERNRWKYEVLECRVLTTIRLVTVVRNWLPRLLTIAESARQAEKMRAARRIRNRFESDFDEKNERKIIKTFDAFVDRIYPGLKQLVEHGAFCSLGSFVADDAQVLRQTYGSEAPEKLLKLITSPLAAYQSSKCASEFATLTAIVLSISESVLDLRPSDSEYYTTFGRDEHYKRTELESDLEETMVLAENSLVTIERRKCIYALDQCAKTCAMRSSGSGIFDGNAILACIRQLSAELTRPESCGEEIEKGVEVVVQKSCEGLSAYVRDRNDAARLRAVSECASALRGSINSIVLEVSYITNGDISVLEDTLIDTVLALEDVMFEDFLSGIRRNMSNYCKLGPMVVDDEDEFVAAKQKSEAQFPSYLSASLLAIVRCRAQVENALGSKTVRQRSDPSTYQFLAMSTAADSVVDAICYEISQRMPRMLGTQAERYSYELQFLVSTLRRYLSDQVIHAVENCRSKLEGKTEAGVQGHGPEGLAAIERLERLGRLYVMCLGD